MVDVNISCLFCAVERRRRFNINDRIKELGTLLPASERSAIKLTNFWCASFRINVLYMHNNLKYIMIPTP